GRRCQVRDMVALLQKRKENRDDACWVVRSLKQPSAAGALGTLGRAQPDSPRPAGIVSGRRCPRTFCYLRKEERGRCVRWSRPFSAATRGDQLTSIDGAARIRKNIFPRAGE